MSDEIDEDEVEDVYIDPDELGDPGSTTVIR